MIFGPERRRHHAARRMVPVGVAILVFVEHEILGQGLAENAFARGPRPRDRLVRLPARCVHNIKRASGHVGDHGGGFTLDRRRARTGVAFGTRNAGLPIVLLQAEHHIAVLGVHKRHCPKAGATTKRLVELIVVDHQGALVGHEVLEGVDAIRFNAGRHFVENLSVPPSHRHVEAVVAGRPPRLCGASPGTRRATTGRDSGYRSRSP
jgi:hypothetical protein